MALCLIVFYFVYQISYLCIMKYDFEINDFIGGWASGNKQWVSDQLARAKSDPVRVRISSLGGLLDHGLDIRSQFVQHGNVHCYIFGMTASAATIIAMGASRIFMSRHAAILIHKCSGWVEEWGQMNADQLQEAIDRLEAEKRKQDALDLIIASCYQQRMQKPLSTITSLLKESRWLTADEALALGLVDELIDDEPDRRVQDVFLTSPSELEALNLPSAPEALAEFTATETAASPWRIVVEKLDAIVQAFVQLFKQRSNESAKSNHNQPQKPTAMKKIFTLVCAFLALNEGFDIKDGIVQITEDQMQELEDHTKQLNDQIAQLTTEKQNLTQQVSDLTQQISDLKKQPGDNPDSPADTHDDGDNMDFGAIARAMASV